MSEEEKQEELEVLESIYAENFSFYSESGRFTVTIQAEEDEDEIAFNRKTQFDVYPLPNFGLLMTFNHPENYPEEPIEYEIEHIPHDDGQDEDILVGQDPAWFHGLDNLIKETIEENVGMAMAFTITSAVQEKLTEMSEEDHKKRKEKIEQLKQEEEDQKTKKLIGTPVTLETFTQWKIHFQNEMKKLKLEKATKFEASMADRLTGKVQFLNKTAKLEVDVDLPEEMQNMEQVEVDEALFDNLEDLDLEEELEGLE